MSSAMPTTAASEGATEKIEEVAETGGKRAAEEQVTKDDSEPPAKRAKPDASSRTVSSPPAGFGSALKEKAAPLFGTKEKAAPLFGTKSFGPSSGTGSKPSGFGSAFSKASPASGGAQSAFAKAASGVAQSAFAKAAAGVAGQSAFAKAAAGTKASAPASGGQSAFAKAAASTGGFGFGTGAFSKGVGQKLPDFKANSKAGFFGKLGGPKSVPLFGSKSPDADKAKVKSGLEGKKTVETGEESERRLIELEVSLYAFEKDKSPPHAGSWQDRGKGLLSVNEDKADKTKVRLVMRQKTTNVLRLNSSVWSGMQPELVQSKCAKFQLMNAADNDVENQTKPLSYLIKSKSRDKVDKVELLIKMLQERVAAMPKEAETKADAKTVTVVMVRHGESEWNALNQFCGWFDAALSESGKKEAAAGAKALKEGGYRFDEAHSSVLQRANTTCEIILDELGLKGKIPFNKTWRLNERHYGGLTGLNKAETADKYGEDQVKIWRRSYDVPPLAMDKDHAYYKTIQEDARYSDIPEGELPNCESLKLTIERSLPYWNESIAPKLKEGKNLIIAAHGNSLRGIVKHLEGLTPEQIMGIDLPTGIPFKYELSLPDLRPVGEMTFLGDAETVAKAIAKVKKQGTKK